MVANEQEEWRAIPTWEGFYEVSDFGRIRRIKNGRGTFSGKVLKPQPHQKGYVKVGLYNKPRSRNDFVHTYVAAAFHGLRPAAAQVNHINGIKTDNRAVNLEYTTVIQNRRHAIANGLHVMPPAFRGEDAGPSMLSEAQVREILLSDTNAVTLAARFGVTKGNIYTIRRRETWKHVVV